jgi:hypothetical protein
MQYAVNVAMVAHFANLYELEFAGFPEWVNHWRNKTNMSVL